MQRLVIGTVALVLVGFLVRAVAVGNNITAANDAVSLTTMLRPAPGFVSSIGDRRCPQFEVCFLSSGVLQPMTRRNATTLLTQFGLGVSNIACQRGTSALTCDGHGTMMGVNRVVDVFFSAITGPDINLANSSAPQSLSGTYVTFGTKALKRLPLTARLQ